MKRQTLVTVALALALGACGGDDRNLAAGPDAAPCSADAPPLTELTASDIAANNRGVALMGSFDYPRARDTFEQVVASQPGWHDACVNLAIATLNRQQEGDEQRALDIVDGVLAQDPGHLRAHYVSGLLNLYLGEAGTAESHFRTVTENMPDDAYGAYYLGQVLVQGGKVEEAIAQYRRAMELDPYLRSAYYGAALALRRSGKADEAGALLRDYQRFENNPRARLAEFKYTRMGPLAEAAAVDRGPPAAPAGEVTELFAAPVDIGALPAPGNRSSMTTADIDADGDQDLFVTRLGAAGTNAVVVQTPEGFAVTGHRLSDVTGVNAAAWGDIDNDGNLDVYLCRDGANQLWQQNDSGEWSDTTESTGVANSDFDCADAMLVDADHDGDLDIFLVNRDGPNELFNNNLDGTFRALAADYDIGGRAGSRQALATDIDNDRDLDLVVIKNRPPHEIFVNDRLWQYRAHELDASWPNEPVGAAVAVDLHGSGFMDIVPAQQLRIELGGDGSSDPELIAYTDAQLIAGDFDGDGLIDIALFDDASWTAYSPHTGRRHIVDETARAATAFMQDPEAGPGLVVLRDDGRLVLHPPSAKRHRFVALDLTGKEERADSMRSNRDGIGTRVALRVGSRWTIVEHIDPNSGPGQSLQPTAIGLGGAGEADFVALTWPDGVFQTELNLAAGAHRIEETQRQLSSCPVLFSWDGQRYRFVTDLLGVGGLGFFVEPGVAATPRPWEYLLLPDGAVAPRDGELVFRITEPMEEIAYLDSARLHVYDLPPEIDLVIDDRMVIAGPAATGEPLFYSEDFVALQAFNDRGDDVTGTVVAVDRLAAPVGEPDRRFIGRLARPHELTLDFATPIDRHTGRPVLVIDGWVEYPYSQTVFAAWQAGAAYEAPTLEAYGGDGRWHLVYEHFGYPAGMPRRMALPLAGLPEGTMRLRLTTNLEVYYDRIAVTHARPAAYTATVMGVSQARQRLIGFPRRTTGPQRLPGYDYDDREAFWDTRYPRGEYSAFGPVTELVRKTDDAVAIIGPGEEVELRFAEPAQALPAGWRRRYVLEVRGWAKDMDLYTYDGGTVGPMPVRAGTEATQQRDRLHERYHTRFQSGF